MKGLSDEPLSSEKALERGLAKRPDLFGGNLLGHFDHTNVARAMI
jgi:hypothetical protein